MAHRLVEGFPDFVFSTSATTRAPRPGERRGVDYDFVSPEEFDAMREKGELVEWARVHGNLYGTPRRNLERAAARGVHAVLDIDVQGARQIQDQLPDALLIFVLPPSAETLVSRLSGRGTEARRELVRRLTNARAELLQAPEFDHAVVNDELERAVDRVRGLVQHGGRPGPVGEELEAMVQRLRDEIEEVLAREFDQTSAGNQANSSSPGR
jgi:guanylate kinase